MNMIPIVLDNSTTKDSMYDLYSLLLKKRIIFLTGEINDITSTNIIAELLYLDSVNNNDISIYINSPGGSVTAGFAIYDTMKCVKSKITTIGVGLCASMGAFLLSSGSKRFALTNCEIMIHEPIGGFSGQASDIKIASERILKLKHRLNQILAKNTNHTIQKIEKDTLKDNYMIAQEAKKYGIIDDIIK